MDLNTLQRSSNAGFRDVEMQLSKLARTSTTGNEVYDFSFFIKGSLAGVFVFSILSPCTFHGSFPKICQIIPSSRRRCVVAQGVSKNG